MPERTNDPKTQIIAISTSDGYDVYSIADLYSHADENGEVHITLNGSIATITVSNNPLWATVKDSHGNPIQSQRALWFAWFANHPNAVLLSP
jgi:hypothetical protein